MKFTAILRNLPDEWLEEIEFLDSYSALNRIREIRTQGFKVSTKLGNGTIADEVDINSLLHNKAPMTHKLEIRRGYKLATFTFAKGD